jgi:hypothetical protein
MQIIKPSSRGKRVFRSWEERDMVAAITDVRGGSKFKDSALKWRIPVQTLRDRFSGKTKPRSQAHGSQQLLSPTEEEVLVLWVAHWTEKARPVSIVRIQRIARDICGTRPGVNWVRRFLARTPSLKLGKPSGLDPKRAQAFNKTTVDDHNRAVARMIAEDRVKVKNIYNMDEKGIQRGGGRRIRNRKYVILNGRQVQYRIQSANLELITIIECVSADGTPLKPAVIFPKKRTEVEEDWINVDPQIG